MNFLRRKLVATITALSFVALTATPASAQQGRPFQSDVAIPVVGTVLSGGTFTGTMSLSSFAVQDGQLVVRGLLTGLLTDSGGAVTTVLAPVAAPVTVAATTCQILNLDLGPLFLNLLGLQIDLAPVVLDITAVAAPGNLLGNLLCAVAGLLDGPALGGLAALLNQILGVLGGLL